MPDPGIAAPPARQRLQRVIMSDEVTPGSSLRVGRYELSDVEWEALSRCLPSVVTDGWPRVEDRRVRNGMVWKIRAGAAWRDALARYGSWRSIYTRSYPGTVSSRESSSWQYPGARGSPTEL
ncbi:transposase [Micromonospora zamorensis]|uniref:transposase n=1 Tax=Micromonospora zamorensis TaxID=709883 RepID=UPI003D958290